LSTGIYEVPTGVCYLLAAPLLMSIQHGLVDYNSCVEKLLPLTAPFIFYSVSLSFFLFPLQFKVYIALSPALDFSMGRSLSCWYLTKRQTYAISIKCPTDRQ